MIGSNQGARPDMHILVQTSNELCIFVPIPCLNNYISIKLLLGNKSLASFGDNNMNLTIPFEIILDDQIQ